MLAGRSILWIGKAEGLDADFVLEAPAADFTWTQDVEEALALPVSRFDAIVLQATDARTARAALARLHDVPSLPPILVQLSQARGNEVASLTAAGDRKSVV